MSDVVIGIDTSNYRTSVSAVTIDGIIVLNDRKLLPVSHGDRGLRQSDAVFSHIRQLQSVGNPLREIASRHRIAAVAASVSPADGAESYMPVFQAGKTIAMLLASSLNVPFFPTTHQRGHLAAAAAGTLIQDLDDYLAMHLSGGTTDLLCVHGDHIRRIGYGMDLHAGQLVDRAGVSMGLDFPSGPQLENLAAEGEEHSLLGCSMEADDLNCHLSGAEAQIRRWILEGNMSRENIAREIYSLLSRTFARMAYAGFRTTGFRNLLVTGGIASSPLFRKMFSDRISKLRCPVNPVFGKPEFSGDNAVGVALIGIHKLLQSR